MMKENVEVVTDELYAWINQDNSSELPASIAVYKLNVPLPHYKNNK